jgi:hypothetical protein
MGDKLRGYFVEQVYKQCDILVIVHSTPSINHVDQLNFVLRYVLPDGQIKERFFIF